MQVNLNQTGIDLVDGLLNNVEVPLSDILDTLSNVLGTRVLGFRNNNTALCVESQPTGDLVSGLVDVLNNVSGGVTGQVLDNLNSTVGGILGSDSNGLLNLN